MAVAQLIVEAKEETHIKLTRQITYMIDHLWLTYNIRMTYIRVHNLATLPGQNTSRDRGLLAKVTENLAINIRFGVI